MTRDGLRQFWFDGETLFRSSRADVELAFSTLEWKTTSDTDQGGVYFHYKNAGLKDSGDLRKNAFKIQLAGDYSIRNTPDKFATGGLFGIKGPTSNAVKPNGQWNTLVLRVAENRVNAAVNGIEVLDTPASLRNIAPLGFICLDGEFPGISYRKMLVYELPQPLKR